jgi:hypothetical protein
MNYDVWLIRGCRATRADRMGFRFRRSLHIPPGIRLNIGKRGVSTSIGVRGAHVTFGKTGTRTTVGLPGSGLSNTHLERGEDTIRVLKHAKPPRRSSARAFAAA